MLCIFLYLHNLRINTCSSYFYEINILESGERDLLNTKINILEDW